MSSPKSPKARSAAADAARKSAPDTIASLRGERDIALQRLDHYAREANAASVELDITKTALTAAEGALKWHEDRTEALVRDLAREQAERRACEKRERNLLATVAVLTGELAQAALQIATRDEVDDYSDGCERIRKAAERYLGGTTIPADEPARETAIR